MRLQTDNQETVILNIYSHTAEVSLVPLVYMYIYYRECVCV